MMNLKALRKELYESAGYIRYWLDKQSGVKEESITDWLLFNLSENLPNVLYHAFTRHQEARETGADWEWWFLFPECYYIRFRVQAKKISITQDNYYEIARTNKYGLQIEKLLESSQQVNAVPLYALYTSVTDDPRCENQQVVQNDGVFIAAAQEIYDSFIKGCRQKVTNTNLLKLSTPLSCFGCCPLVTVDGGVLQQYLQNYFQFGISSVIRDSENFKGLHSEIPGYLSSFLEHKKNKLSDWWEQEFQFDLQDFNALLICDFRSYGDRDFDPVICSGKSLSNLRTDTIEQTRYRRLER